MTDIRPDLARLFNIAFGVKSPVFIPDLALDNLIYGDQTLKFPDAQIKSGNSPKWLSWLGTPVDYQTKFVGGKYNALTDFGSQELTSFPDFILPVGVLIDFSRSKNIIRTPVPMANGTVKELFGFNNWEIRIRGLCLNEPNRSAEDQKKALIRWSMICAGINVSGELFGEKEIDCIVIDSIDFKQLEKQPYVFPFEMNCRSTTHPLLYM